MSYAFLKRRALTALATLACASLFTLAPALADSPTIIVANPPGINGFSSGFTLNQGGSGPVPSISGNTLQITDDGSIGQYNSAIYGTRQSIGSFSASFTYQETYDPSFSGLSPADGVTFVLENDPRGVSAYGFGGSDLGYSDQQGGGVSPIRKSAAIALNIYDGHTSGSNLLTGGKNPGFVYNSIAPVFLNSGDPIDVQLNYDGATLVESVTDEVTLDMYSISYAVNIPAAVGGNLAYVGFTGATGGGTANQYISNFVFTANQPELSVIPGTILGGKDSRGFIRLTSPVSAKTVFNISSSDSINVTVPSTVTFSKGQMNGTFGIATQPIANTETVTISAQANGMTLPALLTVDAAALVTGSVQISTNPIVGGNVAFASVNLNGPAPAGGVTVSLGVPKNTLGAVTAFYNQDPNSPGAVQITSVTIPAGATFADFAIQTNEVTQQVTVQIQATANGAIRMSPLTVLPPSGS